jgi:hypothetical protein
MNPVGVVDANEPISMRPFDGVIEAIDRDVIALERRIAEAVAVEGS